MAGVVSENEHGVTFTVDRDVEGETADGTTFLLHAAGDVVSAERAKALEAKDAKALGVKKVIVRDAPDEPPEPRNVQQEPAPKIPSHARQAAKSPPKR